MRKVERRENAQGITYRVRFRRADPQGVIRQTSETFTSKKQAETFATLLDTLGVEDALDWLYSGEDLPESPTLNQVAEDHFDHLIGVEPGTEAVYRALWKRTWSPRIGHLPVNQIGEDEIGKALNDLGRNYSLKSLKNQRGLLSSVMKRAVKKKYIDHNPVQDIKRLPTGQRSRGSDEMRILTVEEFGDLIERVSDHYKPFVRFLWGTGARWGEAVALQAGDIRWPNVTISRASKYAPIRSNVSIGPPKNRKKRTITLPPELKDELLALAATRQRDELLFQTPAEAMILHQEFWKQVWEPSVRDLEKPRPRIHDLRHSHISHLLARGVPIHVVSDRAGHSSIKITVDTYGHLQPDAQKWAAQAAQMAFMPVLRQVEEKGPSVIEGPTDTDVLDVEASEPEELT